MKTNFKNKTDRQTNVVLSKENTKHVTFTSYFDALLQNLKKDTSYSDIAIICNENKAKYNNKINYTASVIKAHLRYRIETQKQKAYLSDHNLKRDDKNMYIRVIVKKQTNVTETVKETVTDNK